MSKIYRAVEPDWEKVIETAEQNAWRTIYMIREWTEMNQSASKIGLTACQFAEKSVSDLQQLVNGVH